jgi:polyhydroxyalkanoate synthesis regulator phasin
MIDINKEAEEFLKSKGLTGQQNKTISEWIIEFLNNSKAAQARVLNAEIERIEIVINCYNLLHEDISDLKLTISRLQQQLKDLETNE